MVASKFFSTLIKTKRYGIEKPEKRGSTLVSFEPSQIRNSLTTADVFQVISKGLRCLNRKNDPSMYKTLAILCEVMTVDHLPPYFLALQHL